MAAVVITTGMMRDRPAIPSGKRYVRLFDAKAPGMFVEFWPETATVYVRTRDAYGRQRDRKLGRYDGSVTLDQFRRLANEVKAELILGRDRFADAEARRAILTVGEYIEKHYRPWVEEHHRSKQNFTAYGRRILRKFRHLRLDEVTRTGVAEFRRGLIDEGLAPGTVNRHLATLRAMFSKAREWDFWSGPNPAERPQLLAEASKIEALTVDQHQALARALDVEPNRDAAGAIFLLMITGARKSEVLNARWQDVDLGRRILTVPRSKHGRPRYIPLSEPAVALLRVQKQRKVEGNEYVFPGLIEGKPLESVRRAWERAKKRAGIPADFRLHGLRHSLASQLANSGRALAEIGEILGHRVLATTQKYVHYQTDRLVETVSIPAREWKLLAHDKAA